MLFTWLGIAVIVAAVLVIQWHEPIARSIAIGVAWATLSLPIGRLWHRKEGEDRKRQS